MQHHNDSPRTGPESVAAEDVLGTSGYLTWTERAQHSAWQERQESITVTDADIFGPDLPEFQHKAVAPTVSEAAAEVPAADPLDIPLPAAPPTQYDPAESFEGPSPFAISNTPSPKPKPPPEPMQETRIGGTLSLQEMEELLIGRMVRDRDGAEHPLDDALKILAMDERDFRMPFGLYFDTIKKSYEATGKLLDSENAAILIRSKASMTPDVARVFLGDIERCKIRAVLANGKSAASNIATSTLMAAVREEARKRGYKREEALFHGKPGDPKKIVLPPVVGLGEMARDAGLIPQPDIVAGLVRKQQKLILSAPSKGRKTFVLMHMAIAVSNGLAFWGRGTLQSRVLYLNFELDPADFKLRALDIARAVGGLSGPVSLDGVDVLNMRGYAASIDQLVEPILERAAARSYGLIVFDPIYKCLGSRDENSAGDMNDFLNHMETIARRTGATMAMAHHYAKGAASGKNAIDRSSGSGVLARDPDAIMNISEMREELCMSVSAQVRAHAPIDEFGVRWDYPLFRIDASLDPSDLKSPIASKGQPTHADVAEAIGVKVLNTKGLVDAMTRDLGFGIVSSRAAIRDAIKAGVIVEDSREKKGGQPNIFFKRTQKGDALVESSDPLAGSPTPASSTEL